MKIFRTRRQYPAAPPAKNESKGPKKNRPHFLCKKKRKVKNKCPAKTKINHDFLWKSE